MNHKYNVVYLKGPVPGHKNTYVRLTDAMMRPNCRQAPFPTHVPSPHYPSLPEEVYADNIHTPHQATLLFPDKRKVKK